MTTRPPAEPWLLNRELSLLKFNERVLAMAESPTTPLLERLRYVCILSSNLDEFFEIRISSLKEQQRQSPNLVGPDGMTPDQAFDNVQRAVHELVTRQYALLNDEILPAMQAEGIALHHASEWNPQQQEWAHEVFIRDVMPLLTPIGLDPAHPFPRVYNKSLNFIVSLSGADAFGRQASIAVVQAPRALPRLIKMPPELSGHPEGYILLTSLLRAFVGELFPGLEMLGCYQWRVTRNSDLFVDEEEVTNLRHALQGELSQRNFGAAVRLEIDKMTPPELETFLQREFSLKPEDTYRVPAGEPVAPHAAVQCQHASRVAVPRLPRAGAGAVRPRRRQARRVVRGGGRAGPAAAPSVPVVPARHRFPDSRRAGSGRDGDQADHLPHRRGFRADEDPAGRRSRRQGGDGGGGADGALRRADQYQLGLQLEEVGAHVVYGVVAHKTHAKMAVVLRRERAGCAATPTWAPATTILVPRACTPTSAC